MQMGAWLESLSDEELIAELRSHLSMGISDSAETARLKLIEAVLIRLLARSTAR